MPIACRSCHKPPAAHFDGKGNWRPPKGCRIVQLAELAGRVTAWAKKGLARVRYYALPVAKTMRFTPGTHNAIVSQIVIKAGAAGITPDAILTEAQKTKPHLTHKGLAYDLHALRHHGAIASVKMGKKTIVFLTKSW